MVELIPRTADARLRLLAEQLRIVIVNGPRQSGKSTLLKAYQGTFGGSYRTLDDEDTLHAAQDDPPEFARFGALPRMIDEVQRGDDRLVRAIKLEVDERNRPGMFILSGSSRFLTVPNLSESLAGRAVFVDLWPLSMAERTGGPVDFLDRAFGDPASLRTEDSAWSREDYLAAVVAGGYPEALELTHPVARAAWYRSYLATVIDRDIRDMAQLHQAQALPNLLGLLAARAGGAMVVADLARSIGLDRQTVHNYLGWLDMVFLTMRVSPWSTNQSSRLSKHPKLYPTDSGLAAHLLGVSLDDLRQPGHQVVGGLVETMVATELLKLRAVANAEYSLRYFRDAKNREIDFVIEGPQGKLVAVEVKASTSPGDSAFANLRWLRDRVGDRMVAGIVLHLGRTGASRGGGMYSIPLSALWGHAELPWRRSQ